MKKNQVLKLIFTATLILVFSSCVSKKKKKCNTCPDWGKIEVEKWCLVIFYKRRNRMSEEKIFLEQYIYFELTNLNTGFDVNSI